MFFGITMSPAGWLIAFFLAILLVFTPFFIVGAIAEPLQDPFRTIVNVVGSFVVAPALVSYIYHRKMKNTGRGSAIFWIYCGFFVLMFAVFVSHLFSKELSFETIIAPIVTGAVAFYMISFAYKTKSTLKDTLNAQYEAEREDDVKRQAEAILLAEKIKSEQTKTGST